MKSVLEIACFDLRSALIAAESGADRIEFCADYSIGGVTPNVNETKELLNKVKIPVFVMLRIRAGFHSQKGDLEIYLKQIEEFKSIGVNGFVIGFLDDNNEIDIPFNQTLLNAVKPLPCTFHRAVDYTSNYISSLEQLVKMGFDRVLTSGGPGNAFDYLSNLKNANDRFGKEMVILPGGGIRNNNVAEIKNKTGCYEFHSAAMMNGAINPEEIKNILNLI